jgi:hypothetical protein
MWRMWLRRPRRRVAAIRLIFADAADALRTAAHTDMITTSVVADVPVDVSRLTAAQRWIVRAFVEGLRDPHVFVFVVGDAHEKAPGEPGAFSQQ